MFEIAKNEWMNLFNEKSYTAWKDEDQKFRKFAMILSVLNEEFKDIKKQSCKCNDDAKSCITIDSSQMDECTGELTNPGIDSNNLISNGSSTSTFSPDLFSQENFHFNDCLKQENELSPVIKYKKKNKETQSTLYSHVFDIDDSFIVNTPKAEKSKSKFFLNKMKKSNVQKTRLDDDDDDDITFLDITNSLNVAGTSRKSSPPKKHVQSRLQLKTNSPNKRNNLCENSNDNEPNYAYVEKGIRGKARKKLDGWSCKDCENFYSGLNLDPIELKKMQNKCSKHRSKFAPIPCTPEDFWDLTIKKPNK